MEQVFNATKKHIRSGSRNLLLLLITVAILFLGGLYGTYRGLIVNSTQMGEELVQSYVADEERNLLLYQNLVKVGVTYLDQLTDQGLSMEEVSRRLIDYMNATSHALSDTELSLSLAMNGQLTYDTDAVVPEDYNYLDSPGTPRPPPSRVKWSLPTGSSAPSSISTRWWWQPSPPRRAMPCWSICMKRTLPTSTRT